jgi:hypothetical protein
MSNFLRSAFVGGIAALALAGVVAPSTASAQRMSPFDGRWSVVINTLRGDCGNALRYGVRIVGGRVVGEESNYQVAGAVAPNGGIRVTVAEAGRSASGEGKLAGNAGRGIWRTSTGECSGSWTAVRRDW